MIFRYVVRGFARFGDGLKAALRTVRLNMFEKPSAKLQDAISKRFDEIGALLQAKGVALEKK